MKTKTPFERGFDAGTRARESRGDEVLVAICLDESGSMNSIAEATMSAFNEYIESLYAEALRDAKDGTDFYVTLTQFSDLLTSPLGRNAAKARVKYEALPLHRVPELTEHDYRPNGNTPLYDAIGHTIRSAEQWQEAQLGRRVLLVIQTDGYENASRDFTRGDIVQLIQRHENQGSWTALFLGAGIDAWASAQGIGIRSVGNTLHYDHTVGQTSATASRLGAATRFYATSGSGYNADTITLDSALPSQITAEEEAQATNGKSAT